MNNLIRYPLSIFVLSFFAMWLAAQIGDFLRERRKILDQEEQQEHDFVVTEHIDTACPHHWIHLFNGNWPI